MVNLSATSTSLLLLHDETSHAPVRDVLTYPGLDLNPPSRVVETHKPSGSDSILQTIRPNISWPNEGAKTRAHGAGTNFDKIVETATSYEGINVSLYKSRETGLKVLIADVKTPIVRNALPLPA